MKSIRGVFIMIDIKEKDKIRIYNDGVLLIEGNCYNEIKSTAKKAIKIIHDTYQLDILNEILRELSEVAYE